MSKRQMLSLLLAATLAFGPLAWAAPGPAGPEAQGDGATARLQRVPIEVFQFRFESEDGKVSNFFVRDGGSLRITNDASGLYYRLTAHKGKEGRVEIQLRQFTDASRETPLASESLMVESMAGFQASSIAPFRIQLTGTKMEMAKLIPLKDVQQDNYIACCIFCGDWWICCEIEVYSPGWAICCYIEMCGIGCTICEAIPAEQ